MRKDKEEAINLRKDGMSYKEIRDRLRIPNSTLSDWFTGEDWSGKIRETLTEAANEKSKVRLLELDRVRGEHLKKVYEEAREEAAKELETLKYNPLFIAGMMLYWGEGDRKSKGSVRLNNADPDLVRLFVLFLRNVCRIPDAKIRAYIHIYPDIDGPSNIRFWSFATGIPMSQFSKNILIQGRHKTNRLRYGVCTAVVSSTYFKVKMLEWLKLFPKQLMDKAYYENIGP